MQKTFQLPEESVESLKTAADIAMDVTAPRGENEALPSYSLGEDARAWIAQARRSLEGPPKMTAGQCARLGQILGTFLADSNMDRVLDDIPVVFGFEPPA
jgi:hypothetical protein